MKAIKTEGNILLIGGSGYIGRNLCKGIKISDIVTTGYLRRIPREVYFDITSMRLRDLNLDFKKVSHAIVLTAISKLDECAANSKRSHQVNVDSLLVLLEDLRSLDIFPIFTSTDAVFNGKVGNYSEEDEPNPVLLYGIQKLTVERFIQQHFSEYLILRLCRVYGSEINDGTFATSMAKAILESKLLRCAHDQIFSPIHIDDVVKGVSELIHKKSVGIYHLAGPDAVSRVQIYEKLFKQMSRYGNYKRLMEVCSIHDFNFIDRRPQNTSLQIEKLCKDTNFTPSSIHTRIDDFCTNLFYKSRN